MRPALNVALIYKGMKDNKRNLGQTAAHAGMSPKTLAKILETQRMPFYPDALFRLCDSLGLDVGDVVISDHGVQTQKKKRPISVVYGHSRRARIDRRGIEGTGD